MFDSVLVANRGEIAVRVIRTLRALGVRSIAVHSDADANARHVTSADTAIRIGPAAAAESYLNIERLLDAARQTGAQAIHPGYGFLSENTAFARACDEAGLVFIGPPAAAIEAMGDKIRAKQTVAAAGVPVVPGTDGAGLTDEQLIEASESIGFPILIKPSAGGGGKGMRPVHAAADLPSALASARREARGAFGDDTLLLERLVATPRHIEIQVMADRHGNVIHLGERECSLQRRHQKIVEEAPSALLDEPTRKRMGASAVAAAAAVGYVGAGTVEFIMSGEQGADEYFFMEMNTRLQVEHPVTELVTGIDLVELQLRVASGEPLPFAQDDIRLDGHAIEARIYAETASIVDGSPVFLPSGGTVLALDEPAGGHVRIDSGLVVGGTVGSDYDPMLSKVIAWGAGRESALRRLDGALGSTVLLGVPSNVPFLRALLADEDVRAGRLDTGLVERRAPHWALDELPADVPVAAAMIDLLRLEPTGGVVDPFDIPGGWRIGEPAWTTWDIRVQGHDPVSVRTRGRAASAVVVVGDGEPVAASVSGGDGSVVVTIAGVTRPYRVARDGVISWLGRDGAAWAVRERDRSEAASAAEHAGDGTIVAPMPGTVTVVDVADGDHVSAGQRLLIVEAMKMEHELKAPIDGTVSQLQVRVGSTVARDATLAVVTAAAEEES